jgi:hypothetical protein
MSVTVAVAGGSKEQNALIQSTIGNALVYLGLQVTYPQGSPVPNSPVGVQASMRDLVVKVGSGKGVDREDGKPGAILGLTSGELLEIRKFAITVTRDAPWEACKAVEDYLCSGKIPEAPAKKA